MVGREIYAFGEFTLDVDERRLSRGRTPVRVAPKAHDVLVALVRDPGHLVTKHELLSQIWREAFVDEGILTVHISSLRRALGDTARPSRYIETVSGSGYRFIAPVAKQRLDVGEVSVRRAVMPLEVYELVGRGRGHLSASYFELKDAIAAFRAAIAIDSTYAPAHAGLALARCAEAGLRAAPHLEAYAEAKASALRALAMDSECADAQVALGAVLFVSEWDWVGAERSFRRALEVNAAHPEALLHYGSLMEALGDLDQALRLKQQALERDPRSPLVFVQLALCYWHRRQYDNAIVWAQRALALDPRHLLAGEFLAGAYWKQGDLDRLLVENLRRARVFGVSGEMIATLERSCAEMKRAHDSGGQAQLAQYMLDHMPRRDGGAASLQLAVLQGAVGNLDAAFDHLDQALAVKDPALVHLAVAPQWDSLRGDARFTERLQAMGLWRRAVQS